jgi:farnesol dehydrogenase
MKILVTGGTGFLGRRIVSELAERHELRLLVRGGSSRDRFPANVEFAAGDVTDRLSLVRAMAGCDAVVHAAALVKILAPALQFDRINVGGLDNILSTAEQSGSVEKLVYVSSFIALGPTENGPGGELDETAEVGDRAWINDYERTKALADRRARKAIADGAPLSVVYPGVIYGPGEMTEGNIVVRHILDLVRGKLPALIGKPERRWNYVNVADVARGVALTLEKGKPGSRYMLGGENVTQAEFYALVGRLTGAKIPTMRLPDWAAKAAYRSDRAAAEIGYTWRTLEQGLTETVAWMKESGVWKQ